MWTTEYMPKDIPGYENRTERPGRLLSWIQQGYVALYLIMLLCVALTYQSAGLVSVRVICRNFD